MENVLDLKTKIQELRSKQYDLELRMSSLKREKKAFDEASDKAIKPSSEIASIYKFIFPLVEEIYLLELKEKELKEKYHDKKLASEARLLGRQLVSESFSEEETVLKTWHEELRRISKTNPPISTTSAESQECPTVHNIVYSCKHDSRNLTENLAFTVLCQAVHARLKIRSVLPCSNIHFNSACEAEIQLICDNHIPGLEEIVLQLLENNSSIQGVISKIGDYIASDMAPFVISIPMKKKGKKNKKESMKKSSSGCSDQQSKCNKT